MRTVMHAYTALAAPSAGSSRLRAVRCAGLVGVLLASLGSANGAEMAGHASASGVADSARATAPANADGNGALVTREEPEAEQAVLDNSGARGLPEAASPPSAALLPVPFPSAAVLLRLHGLAAAAWTPAGRGDLRAGRPFVLVKPAPTAQKAGG